MPGLRQHGEDARYMLKKAADDMGEKGAAVLENEGEEIPDLMVVEQKIRTDGSREFRITVLPDNYSLLTMNDPEPLPSVFCWFCCVLAIIAGAWLLAVGAFALAFPLTYFWLRKAINRVVIRLEPDRLSVTHSPMPWPGWSWSISQVIGLETVGTNSSGEVYRPHKLTAIRDDGRRRTLIRGASTDQIYFIQDFIKTVLGLSNEAIYKS